MTTYDYDFFVIGGGSGGLAAAKAAADLNVKVAVADFVKPSPQGTSWGLGGTCVNVGCIPKKLMHIGASYREIQGDAHGLGWESKTAHSWEDMVTKVNNYILSLNWGNKTDLNQKNIKYYNAYATFIDDHTVKLVDKKSKETKVTAKYILIATGGRPNYDGLPGDKECCISSDDIFWQKKAPGKVLVIGASYIALECAGFLAGFGFDVSVMVRSILLRGFDQDFAEKIGDWYTAHGIKLLRPVKPSKYEKTADGRVKVFVDDKEYGVYDTVLQAIGRYGLGAELNLEAAGVEYDKKSGKIPCKNECTNKPNIFACGDIVKDMPELTPVAIQAGRLLVNRLFKGSTKQMDYTDIATAVFTQIEFGTVGLSEEDAKAQFGKENIIVYHTSAKPLEWNLNEERSKDQGYMKVICDKSKGQKVVGFHVLGPHAGEIIQGISVAIKAGFTKEHLTDCVGIHPTFAEAYTTLTEEKKEGDNADVAAAGC